MTDHTRSIAIIVACPLASAFSPSVRGDDADMRANQRWGHTRARESGRVPLHYKELTHDSISCCTAGIGLGIRCIRGSRARLRGTAGIGHGNGPHDGAHGFYASVCDDLNNPSITTKLFAASFEPAAILSTPVA